MALYPVADVRFGGNRRTLSGPVVIPSQGHKDNNTGRTTRDPRPALFVLGRRNTLL